MLGPIVGRWTHTWAMHFAPVPVILILLPLGCAVAVVTLRPLLQPTMHLATVTAQGLWIASVVLSLAGSLAPGVASIVSVQSNMAVIVSALQALQMLLLSLMKLLRTVLVRTVWRNEGRSAP